MKNPTIPAELWMLWDDDIGWIVAIEGEDVGEPLLAFLSKKTATKEARVQNRLHGLKCKPVCVKEKRK